MKRRMLSGLERQLNLLEDQLRRGVHTQAEFDYLYLSTIGQELTQEMVMLYKERLILAKEKQQ